MQSTHARSWLASGVLVSFRPGAQSLQVLHAVAPLLAANVPAGQVVHVGEPVAPAKVPAVHWLHDVAAVLE